MDELRPCRRHTDPLGRCRNCNNVPPGLQRGPHERKLVHNMGCKPSCKCMAGSGHPWGIETQTNQRRRAPSAHVARVS